jgi:hypothetical protein
MDVVRLIAVVEEGRYKVGIKQRRGWFYGHLVHWYIIWEGKGVGGMKEGVGGERGGGTCDGYQALEARGMDVVRLIAVVVGEQEYI